MTQPGIEPQLPDHWRTLYPLDQWLNTNKIIKLSRRSYPDSGTYSDSKIEDSTPCFPSYIVLESAEDKPITQLFLFILEKILSENMAPKWVKATHNNTLIVEVKKKKYAELRLRTPTLHNMKIKTYSHRSYNTS